MSAIAIAFICFYVLALIGGANLHGRKIPSPTMPKVILTAGIFHALFWWGGFYDTIEAPQLIALGLTVSSLGAKAIGGRSTYTVNFYTMLISVGIWISILSWGGFFS